MPADVCAALTLVSKRLGIEYKEPSFRIKIARLALF
jgi:hypothetical protein